MKSKKNRLSDASPNLTDAERRRRIADTIAPALMAMALAASTESKLTQSSVVRVSIPTSGKGI